MIQINECLICGYSNFKFITKRGYHFSGEKVLLCTNCGLVFLTPRMTTEELEDFYQSNRFSKKFRGSEIPTLDMVRYREKRAKRRLMLLAEHLAELPEGPILEIGCSSGNFLRLLSNRGYEVFGIDPSKGFAEYAKKEYGLKVVSGMYPNDLPNEFNGPFAAVAAFHVLEHTSDPLYILKTGFKQLKKGGLLFLEIPDIERVVTHRKYIHHDYFQKSHLWDFSRSTITLLLKSCGFQVCDYFYEAEPPYDKNILIVARKQGENSKLLGGNNDNVLSLTPQQLLRLLKMKLLLGQLVKYIFIRFKKKDK